MLNVEGFGFIGIFGIGAGVVAFADDQLRVMLFEGVGDVLKKDKAKDDVLIFGRVNVAAELSAANQSLASKPIWAAELAAVFEEERARDM